MENRDTMESEHPSSLPLESIENPETRRTSGCNSMHRTQSVLRVQRARSALPDSPEDEVEKSSSTRRNYCSGIRGLRGAAGIGGPSGRNGSPGEPGTHGAPGPAGPDGETGPQGQRGIDGQTGVGPQGVKVCV